MLKELLETAGIAKSVFKCWNDRLPEENSKDTEIVQSIRGYCERQSRQIRLPSGLLIIEKQGYHCKSQEGITLNATESTALRKI